MFQRIVVLIVLGVVSALLHGRGAFARVETAWEDALLRVSARVFEAPGRKMVRVYSDGRPHDAPASAQEIVETLDAFASMRSSAAVVSLPASLQCTDAEAAAIRRALFALGRVVMVLAPGDHEAPSVARLDRIGKGDDLEDAPLSASLDERIVAGLHAVAIDDLRIDADGVARRFVAAYGAREETVPSLPVAIAACALHESSLRLSRDLRTLEAFGARDLRLADRNEFRIRYRFERVFEAVPVRDVTHRSAERKRPPVRLLVFAGSPLQRTMRTALGDDRTAAEIVADCVDDLLVSKTSHPPNPRLFGIALVVLPALLVAIASRFKSRVRRLAFFTFVLVTATAAAFYVASVSSLLTPVFPFAFALAAGTLVDALLRKFGGGLSARWSQRPMIG